MEYCASKADVSKLTPQNGGWAVKYQALLLYRGGSWFIQRMPRKGSVGAQSLPLSFFLFPGSGVEDLFLPLLETQSNEVTLCKTGTSRTIG